MQAYEKDGTSVSYTYDANGMRASKTVNGVTTEYLYLDGALRYEKCGNDSKYYLYDGSGHLANIKYYKNGSNTPLNIYVLTNLQGDIVGLYNYNGELKVSYEYDAWGNTVSVTDNSGANWNDINPFRYRGYYYDTDTGLYYLGSRYYNPEVGRFLNADIPETTSSDFENFIQYNLFAYCFNNSINMSDENGTWPSWATKIAIGVGAIVIGAAVVAATAATGGAAAAFVGAVGAGLKAAALSGAIGAAVGAGTSAISHRVSTGGWNGVGKTALSAAVDGFANGFMTGGISSGASMALGALGKNLPGIQFGKTQKPQYGKVNIGYGTPKTNGTALISFQNNAGKRILGFELDLFHAFHMHLPKILPNKHIPIGAILSGIYGGVK